MKQVESLVLVPGLMCDAATWPHQIAGLSAGRDIQVAEHGLSDTLGNMAQRILDAAPPRFALAGHSMGGRVALEVVARAPERVSRLALLDSGYEALEPGEAGARETAGRYRLLEIAQRDGMLAMARDWAQGMVHPSRLGDSILMDAIHGMIVRAGVAQFEAQIRALLARPDRTELLQSLRLPTLVLCGRDDSWSPLSRHEQMAQFIPGSQLVAVPDCGHMSTMERPEAVTKAMLAWLESPLEDAVTDTLPDRLCVDPASRYYDEKLLARDIGIRFNGVERTNVEEYCISEGWIRSAVGKTLDRRGKPLTVQLKGKVEPFFKE